MTGMPKIQQSGRLRGLTAVAALSLLQGLAAGAGAFATRTLFEQLHSSANLSILPLVILIGSGFVIAFSRIIFRVVGERLGQSFALDIRKALYAHTAKMPFSYIQNRRSGYMSLRFVGDMTAFKNWVSLGIPRLIAASIILPITMTVLVILHPPIAYAVIPILILPLAMIIFFGLKMRRLHSRLRARRALIAADMVERMPLAPQLDLLGRTSAELKQVERRTNRMVRAAVARSRRAELLKAFPEMFAGLAAAIIIWTGSQTSASTAQIAAALATLGLTFSPIRELAGVVNYWAAYLAAHKKCFAIFQRKTRDQADKGLKTKLRSGPLTLEVRNLSVGTVQDVSFKLGQGERGVLLGKNGYEKSRLIAAIAGLERIEQGEILLNSVPIQAASNGSLRRGVALISSTVPMLKGSLRRSLTLGLSARPADEQILEKVVKFHLSELLNRIGGLDGEITEHGRNLSSGEHVRIACVRAALGNPGLILLEQVFSCLGAEEKKPVEHWLNNLSATVLSTDADISFTKTIHLRLREECFDGR